MILTIERECGSGGHVVAEHLAEIYSLPLYDKQILNQKATELGVAQSMGIFFDERPMESLLYPVVKTGEIPEFGKETFSVFRSLIKEEDFILIGRCGNYIYRKEPELVSIFLHAEVSDRIHRTMMKQGVDRFTAGKLVDEVDDKRRRFHKYYTGKAWGQAADYDITLNTSFLGIDGTVDLIHAYVEGKMERIGK